MDMAGKFAASRFAIDRRTPTGRPPGIKVIPARFEIPTIGAIDTWAEKHDVSRSEAVRRLVELGLKAKGK